MIIFNLNVLLAERNLKITDVHKATGISRTTLTSIYYNYAKGIQLDTLDTLCKYLKITPNDLLAREDLEYDFKIVHAEDEQGYTVQKLHAIIQHNGKTIDEKMDFDFYYDVNENAEIEDYKIYLKMSDKTKNMLSQLPPIFFTAIQNDLQETFEEMLEQDHHPIMDGAFAYLDF